MHLAPFSFAALTAALTLSPGAFSVSLSKAAILGSTAGVTSSLSDRTTSLGPSALRFGRSLGSPTDGHLVGGAHLVESGDLRVMPNDAAGDVRWGLEPLVAMIERAARAVRRQFPGAIESVGHLSRRGGGDIERHRSHESGRDADVGFYIRSATGRELFPSHFVPFRADGTAPSWRGAYFDDARNWALVAALLSDPQAHVTHLFVASPIRARLLAYAERASEPIALRVRAAELMQQPHGVLPHDDHFHVRI
ncbi:MAG: penicillin-insensitive murein endopeptidase, partial [Polyangiaceae bacterium]